MASSGNDPFDKNTAAKKNFLRKFGRRMGNVFTRKRVSRGELEDVSAPVLLPSGVSSDSNVVINPLMGADIPTASHYQSSKSYPIIGASDSRNKGGGGGGMVTGKRLSGEFPAVSSAISEESVTATGLPPERCLSEGNLIDSSPPTKDQLGGLGGRVWRAVPSSMESLPKSLQNELANKIGSRTQSVSEDEGLPHSPADNALHEKSSSHRGSSQEDARPANNNSFGPHTSILSQSARSLVSCDGSSDGEQLLSLDLDFNALRRAESLDNTAAKHKIQVSRPRKSRPSSNLSGPLRKHKSMSTVQLTEISEEVTPDEPLRRRAPSSDLLTTKPKVYSPAASQLTQELVQMQLKKDTGVANDSVKKEVSSTAVNDTKEVTPVSPSEKTKNKEISDTKSFTVTRTNKPSSTTDSNNVTRLRSMFGTSNSVDNPSENATSPTNPKIASTDSKTHKFFAVTSPIESKPNIGNKVAPSVVKKPSGASMVFSKSYGVSGPPSANPVQRSDPGKPSTNNIVSSRKTTVKTEVKSVTGKSIPLSTPPSKSSVQPTTDKLKRSTEDVVEIREKKPAKDFPRIDAKKSTEETSGGRPVSKVKDLVKNFQRLQETTTS